VLSDPGNKIAQVYGVYRPASGKQDEDQQHGTFVIGRDGLVSWVHHGCEPFTGNRTLLYELARVEGRLPAGSAK
jgi:peroxiredoxin